MAKMEEVYKHHREAPRGFKEGAMASEQLRCKSLNWGDWNNFQTALRIHLNGRPGSYEVIDPAYTMDVPNWNPSCPIDAQPVFDPEYQKSLTEGQRGALEMLKECNRVAMGALLSGTSHLPLANAERHQCGQDNAREFYRLLDAKCLPKNDSSRAQLRVQMSTIRINSNESIRNFNRRFVELLNQCNSAGQQFTPAELRHFYTSTIAASRRVPAGRDYGALFELPDRSDDVFAVMSKAEALEQEELSQKEYVRSVVNSQRQPSRNPEGNNTDAKNKQKKKKPKGKGQKPKPDDKQSKGKPGGKQKSRADDVCHKCGKKGHWARDCRQQPKDKTKGKNADSDSDSDDDVNDKVCSWCLKPGHGISNCAAKLDGRPQAKPKGKATESNCVEVDARSSRANSNEEAPHSSINVNMISVRRVPVSDNESEPESELDESETVAIHHVSASSKQHEFILDDASSHTIVNDRSLLEVVYPRRRMGPICAALRGADC